MPDESKGQIDWEVTLDRQAIIRAMTRTRRKRKKDQSNDNIASLTPGDIDPAR